MLPVSVLYFARSKLTNWDLRQKRYYMKKKVVFTCGIAALLLISFLVYRQTLGAPVIGAIAGPEWEYLTVNGIDYERDNNAPVNGTDREHFMGIATSGDIRVRIYSIAGSDNYLYCMWEWEGYIFKRV